MPTLHRLLYCSRNTIAGPPELVADDIRQILLTSRRNNARCGVTGGLLFSSGCFAQVLEGPVDSLSAVFERIQCDDRHADVVVLQTGPIAARDFASWSMAFAGGQAVDNQLPAQLMADAFAGRTSKGEELLSMLRGIVIRETEWLMPV